MRPTPKLTMRRLLTGIILLSVILPVSFGWAAGTPTLVKDIRPGSISLTFPTELTNVNGTLFFSANDSVTGTELWMSDGTDVGTKIVKDIGPGANGSSPAYLTNVNGTLFFSAFVSSLGPELWKSDGTSAGTSLVKDIFPGVGGGIPAFLTNVNGTLFFQADSGGTGTELWMSDGTDAGTVLVKDIQAGSVGSNPIGLIDVNGTLFFQADGGGTGSELWKSDGTSAGTMLVKDIRPGALGSSITEMTNVGGMLFFSANDGVNGEELWKSDGTTAGTVLVKDIALTGFSSRPLYLTNVNGTLFFSAAGGPGGRELWRSDGSGANTVMVKDIVMGPIGSSPKNLVNVNGRLFFSADDRDHLNGRELWASDGTSNGTVLVKDTLPGSGFTNSPPQHLTNVNNNLFFTVDNGVNGGELWTSDGTTAGTALVKDIQPGGIGSFPQFLTDVNGSLFFVADDGVHGRELWTLAGAQPTTPMPDSSASCASCGTDAEPINTFSGELFEPLAPDINLGGPMSLVFQRYYAAFLRRSFILGDLGNNWRHNFDARLFISGNTAKYVSHKGRVTDFIKDLVTGVWNQQTNLDTTYKLDTPAGQNAALFDPQDNLIYTFDFVTSSLIAGKLATVEDGKGNIHTVTYNAAGQIQTVSDGSGRTLTFTYNTDAIPKISIVSDGTRSILFQYTDPLDTENLTQFKDVRGGFTTYTYKDTTGTADHALMTQWMLPRLNVPFIQTFDAQGRVSTQTNASFEATSLAYDTPTIGQTTLTDPVGNIRVHSAQTSGAFSGMQDQAGQSFSLTTDASGRRDSITDRLGDTTTMSYHAPSGKLAGVTNADGTTESFAYTPRTISGLTLHDISGVTNADGTTVGLIHDAFGNLTSRTDELGNTSTATYNGNGQVLTATNKLSGVNSNTYNADATLASHQDIAGNTTTFAYDGLRRLNMITHADTSTRAITYDSANHPLTTTDENGNNTTMTWDANGNLATVQDALLNTTTLAYDGNDRLISTTDALGGITRMTYHPLGDVGSVTDANNNTVTLGYNMLGRLISLTDALGNVTARSYDAEKIIASTTDPLGNTTTFASDKLGRLTQTTSPLGNINKVSYDPVGRIATMTDGLNQVTTLSRDARGRITGISLPGGAISAAITRNALGEPLSITDPNGNSWQRGYDSSGRLTSSTDPLMQAKSTSYDNRNRPSTITFPGALGTETLTYDGVGNLTGSSYTDGTAFGFTYDANDRLTATNNGGTTPNNMTRAYDAAGRISNSNGIAITRDAGGRITGMTLAAGKTVSYAYDANNHVTSVTDWAGGITTFTYDNAGRLTNITRPNGVNQTNTWDNDSRLTGISEGAVSSINLTRDAKGQITSTTRTVPTIATATGVANSANTFDAASQFAGNTYDARGRQTAAGTDTFTWDAASRLTAYTVGGVTAANVYDSLGYRTRRTVGAATSDFVWNGALGIASISIEKRAGADFRYFIHTPDGALLYSIDAANARSFYHFDEMGNTIFISNDAGATIGSYAYTPYGELIASTGGLDNPFTWQGQNGLMDEGNGLYYVRARFYDAKTGKFISRDASKTIDPRGMNAYQYAYNNPLRYVDINGREPTIRNIEGEEIAAALFNFVTTFSANLGGEDLFGNANDGAGTREAIKKHGNDVALSEKNADLSLSKAVLIRLKQQAALSLNSSIDGTCKEVIAPVVAARKRRDEAAAELAKARETLAKERKDPGFFFGEKSLERAQKALDKATIVVNEADAALKEAESDRYLAIQGFRPLTADLQGVICLG